ncbi:MAG: hypothetical protein AABM43_10740 [Actinomycetota bacterium]
MPDPDLELGAAALGPQAERDEVHQLIAVLKELLGLPDPEVKCRTLILENPLHCGAPPMRARVRPSLDRELEVGVRVAKRRVPVVPVEGLIDDPDKLDVLLRHCLGSIAVWVATKWQQKPQDSTGLGRNRANPDLRK